MRKQSLVIPARLLVTLFAATSLLASGNRTTPRFYDDDPLAAEVDTEDASGVKARELSLTYDAVINLFGHPGLSDVGRAEDVNTIDEVPDSSWFANHPALTPEDVEQGPDRDPGPQPGTWSVSRKANGVSPGFTITDARGRRYFLKFDPVGLPELGTSTEVVVTRLMHALGYNVPQTRVATLRRESLVIAAGATVRMPDGSRRTMRASDLDEQLRRANRNADGTYRVVAGEATPGTPLEGFRYEGTRSDDPNDVIPHENRRSLRGLRVFSAWLSHTDAKAINSLDTLVREEGRSFVRHYLIDFNASLGSAGIGLKDRRDGYEYLAEIPPTLRALPALGFVIRPWMTIDYPTLRGIGRFESQRFVPDEWRPRVPNPAYVRSRPDDTFWAARRVMAMSDEMVRAAVRAGQYTDPRAEQYLVETLIQRRDKIGRSWLTRVNPIIDPALAADGTLTFGNAAVAFQFAEAPAGYRVVWQRFDNATGGVAPIAEAQSDVARVPAPAELPRDAGAFVRVEISAVGAAEPSWADPVHAYFRRTSDAWKLVGFYRMPGAAPMRPGLVGAEKR